MNKILTFLALILVPVVALAENKIGRVMPPTLNNAQKFSDNVQCQFKLLKDSANQGGELTTNEKKIKGDWLYIKSLYVYDRVLKEMGYDLDATLSDYTKKFKEKYSAEEEQYAIRILFTLLVERYDNLVILEQIRKETAQSFHQLKLLKSTEQGAAPN
jgi:hypothetical protein